MTKLEKIVSKHILPGEDLIRVRDWIQWAAGMTTLFIGCIFILVLFIPLGMPLVSLLVPPCIWVTVMLAFIVEGKFR